MTVNASASTPVNRYALGEVAGHEIAGLDPAEAGMRTLKRRGMRLLASTPLKRACAR